MQYTIRQVPAGLDRALRRKAKEQGKSLNRFVIDRLCQDMGLRDQAAKKRDLSSLAGTWVEDPAFDAIMKEQDQIDPEMWK